MKKLLSISSSKFYMASALGLFLVLGAFWHHQVNQSRLDQLNVLNNGVGTCFNRISQTFTAVMIKDLTSPYLDRGFMGLSDECLNETTKGINPFKKNVGKGYQLLNQLLGEVYWFHEAVNKVTTPLNAGKKELMPLGTLADRFSKMETYKMDLIDEVDLASQNLKNLLISDEMIIGSGLIILVFCLSILAIGDFNRHQIRKEIEKEGLNLLGSGKNQLNSVIDQHITRALNAHQLHVTAQMFQDYHEHVMENLSSKLNSHIPQTIQKNNSPTVDQVSDDHSSDSVFKSSLKEALLSIQKIHTKDDLQISDVRDVQMNVPYEAIEQILHTTINFLVSRRPGSKKVMMSNQVHSDKTLINIFNQDASFSSAELDFFNESNPGLVEGIDMNLMILKELTQEYGLSIHLENKVDRKGNISGMGLRLVVQRSPKEQRNKSLVSIVKGKKKDISRDLATSSMIM